MDNIAKDPVIYWYKKVLNTELENFQKIIERKYNVKFDTYWDLHKWTVDNYTNFLEEMWQFFKIIYSKPYEEVLVKTGLGFLDNEWLKGARLNYAENMLRIRDSRIALICLDEFGKEEIVTFAEMFEEVKLYAAAFRKNGLKIGDRVACFISNRKEAIFAMFATASIGAIWGGPVPYYGANAASNVISTMEPKFLITVDEHKCDGRLFPIFDCLPVIVENAPSLEKVIVVVTQDETRKKDLKKIRSCVFLEHFLEEGRTPDGKVTDIIFEQLPFDHPLYINFTSGTTGLPKAVVQSARFREKYRARIYGAPLVIRHTFTGRRKVSLRDIYRIRASYLRTPKKSFRKASLELQLPDRVYVPLLPNNFPELGHRNEKVIASMTPNLLTEVWEELDFGLDVCRITKALPCDRIPDNTFVQKGVLTTWRDFAFTYNLKSGDILCIEYPVGLSIWNHFIQGLSFGITYFLYCGSTCYTLNGQNFWDILAKYKVTFVSFSTSIVDRIEKLHMKPSLESDLSSLRIIGILGSPVKRHNIEYLLSIKKDVFLGITYGATELFGIFAGFNMNMPAYMGEIQVPTLGIDFHCFDSSGKSIMGKVGEAVIRTPAINFPIGLWKDKSKSRITELYLSKFSGVWAQHDVCWINPKTKGIAVIGRSDDTLNQYGVRFGAADVYFAIHSLDELQDYICVSQHKNNGESRAVLFVKMRQGLKLTPEIKAKIEKKVDEELRELCVPELILEIPDIPYNLNNKRMESVVRKIIEKNDIPEVMNIRNPECLKYYVNIPEILNYNQQ